MSLCLNDAALMGRSVARVLALWLFNPLAQLLLYVSEKPGGFMFSPAHRFFNLGYALSFFLCSSTFALAQSLQQDLDRLRKDPHGYFESLPSKTISNPNSQLARVPREAKLKARAQLELSALHTLGPVEPGDEVQRVVPRLRYITLGALESAGLKKATLQTLPWSDDYWPIYAGGISARYADPEFPMSGEAWKYTEEYLLNTLNEVPASSTELLSPAQKYDLIMGDESRSLTRFGITDGRRYVDADGKIENWMGLCHGWAPASLKVLRPMKKISVAVPGHPAKLDFYASDIKALATALWARGRFSSLFTGGRCNEKQPERDENGRPKRRECRDTNPATWHLAITHLVGAQNTGFVFDASWDYEVWNQPVSGYSYGYFDPRTKVNVETLEQAEIPVSEWSDDPSKKYRNPATKKIVGVWMDVHYRLEIRPERRELETEEFDQSATARYLYDLELDENGRIIGGEWYSHAHPDFIWVPAADARVLTPGDFQLARQGDQSRWRDGTVTPEAWQNVSPLSSSTGAPLERVVSELVLRSHL